MARRVPLFQQAGLDDQIGQIDTEKMQDRMSRGGVTGGKTPSEDMGGGVEYGDIRIPGPPSGPKDDWMPVGGQQHPRERAQEPGSVGVVRRPSAVTGGGQGATPSMSSSPMAAAGQAPSPAMAGGERGGSTSDVRRVTPAQFGERSSGLMGSAGGLLGGGIGVGGQGTPQTDILMTLMQMLNKMPGR